jgi:hypothetical protein
MAMSALTLAKRLHQRGDTNNNPNATSAWTANGLMFANTNETANAPAFMPRDPQTERGRTGDLGLHYYGDLDGECALLEGEQKGTN